MNEQAIFDKIVSIVVDKLGVKAEEVIKEASFTGDLGADSLDSVDLIMEFEKEFNITIPDKEAEDVETVEQAIQIVKIKLAE